MKSTHVLAGVLAAVGVVASGVVVVGSAAAIDDVARGDQRDRLRAAGRRPPEAAAAGDGLSVADSCCAARGSARAAACATRRRCRPPRRGRRQHRELAGDQHGRARQRRAARAKPGPAAPSIAPPRPRQRPAAWSPIAASIWPEHVGHRVHGDRPPVVVRGARRRRVDGVGADADRDQGEHDRAGVHRRLVARDASSHRIRLRRRTRMDNLRNRSLGELFTDLESRHRDAGAQGDRAGPGRDRAASPARFARRATFIAIGAVLCLAGSCR